MVTRLAHRRAVANVPNIVVTAPTPQPTPSPRRSPDPTFLMVQTAPAPRRRLARTRRSARRQFAPFSTEAGSSSNSGGVVENPLTSGEGRTDPGAATGTRRRRPAPRRRPDLLGRRRPAGALAADGQQDAPPIINNPFQAENDSPPDDGANTQQTPEQIQEHQWGQAEFRELLQSEQENTAGDMMAWMEENEYEAPSLLPGPTERIFIDRCTSPLCPVPATIPHERGAYYHNNIPYQGAHRYLFGISNPPPAAWLMIDRLINGTPRAGDREVIQAFIRNHRHMAEY